MHLLIPPLLIGKRKKVKCSCHYRVGDAVQQAKAATGKPNTGFDLDQVLARE
jgi:hypothetical protein